MHTILLVYIQHHTILLVYIQMDTILLVYIPHAHYIIGTEYIFVDCSHHGQPIGRVVSILLSQMNTICNARWFVVVKQQSV